MKTNTFILIVTIYTLVLALPAIFAPDMALEYFGGRIGDANEQSSFNFIGGYQLAMSFLGFAAYRSSERGFRRMWLLATAFLTIFAIGVIIYNLNVRMIPATKTIYFDMSLWALLAVSSLYFWNKEK